MSASDSFLMQDGYHYHIVVATSQATVSSTLYEWLKKLERQSFSQAFLWKEQDAAATLVTPASLKEETGADIFTLPHNSPVSHPAIQQLKEKGFCCAFTADPGFKGAPVRRPIKPGPVELRQEGTQVRFNLICSTFTIVALVKPTPDTWQWINITQDINNPWTAVFDVLLSMHKAKVPQLLQQLPPHATALSGGKPDMFSIKKLIMNFTTATLQASPAIAAIQQYDKTKNLLASFITALVHDLGKRTEAMIGYSLLADKPLDTGNGSLVPTDASFIISPHRNEKGQPSDKYDLYTLNYLLMTMGMAMPKPRSFEWNWIETNKITGGIIAINRGVFALYLKDQLKDSLKEVIKRPRITITDKAGTIDITHEFVNEPNQPEFSLPADFYPFETTRCECSVSGSASHPITIHYAPVQVKAHLEYNPIIQVKFSDTALKFTYILRTFYNLTVGEDINTLHLFCVKAITRSYTLGVNTQGQLALTLKETTEESGDFPVLPAKVVNLFAGVSVKLRSALMTSMANMLAEENKKMLSIVNNGINWVFPGTDTFTFSNCYFSGKEDLITEINYAAIS